MAFLRGVLWVLRGVLWGAVGFWRDLDVYSRSVISLHDNKAGVRYS
jgi:hypothetical protein